MKKWKLIILTILLTVFTVVFGLTYISRLRMNYSAEGTYFDENSGVVYHEQAVLVFGTITFILLLLTMLAAWKLKMKILRR